MPRRLEVSWDLAFAPGKVGGHRDLLRGHHRVQYESRSKKMWRGQEAGSRSRGSAFRHLECDGRGCGSATLTTTRTTWGSARNHSGIRENPMGSTPAASTIHIYPCSRPSLADS